jgi:hypothetical protein
VLPHFVTCIVAIQTSISQIKQINVNTKYKNSVKKNTKIEVENTKTHSKEYKIIFNIISP